MTAILEAKWREKNGYNTVDYVRICLVLKLLRSLIT